MDAPQVDLIAFLGALEFALVALVAAVGFGLRGRRLANRVRALQLKARRAEPVTEPIGYEQYLHDEMLRNEKLIDRAAAAQEAADRQAAELFALRKRFLEIELEARKLEADPVAFQAQIAGGMKALIGQLRPEPETVTVDAGVAADAQPEAPPGQDSSAVRESHDTHDEELDHLKQVINNQHDAMALLENDNALLRSELKELQAMVARHGAHVPQVEEDLRQQAGEADLSEQNQQLEIKLQELEALLEFKDAALQELEKQYNILESKYLAASVQKKA